MGDPRKTRKKYSTPSHPWQKFRIDEEKEFIKTYHFKNKTEIWKLASKLKGYFGQVKKLTALKTAQAEKEKKLLLSKLQNLGLLPASAQLVDILSLQLKDVFERRLQTIVFRKGLARSVKQARQFITHGHIFVGDKKITSPNYLITKKEEDLIKFRVTSSLSDPEHSERKPVAPKPVEVKAEKADKADKKRKSRKGKKTGKKGKDKPKKTEDKKPEPKKEAPKEETKEAKKDSGEKDKK